MKILRWILLILYIAIIVGLLIMAYNHGDNFKESLFLTIFLFSVTIIAQSIFIFAAGTSNLCKPIRKRRLIIPVIIAAVMMTLLIAGVTLAIGELLFENAGTWFEHFFWTIIVISWLIWAIIFFIWGLENERYKTLKRYISTMLAGSLIVLFISIPSHIIVSKRSGCFVGIMTAFGIISGIFVMFWAFGPGIILLFLREKRKAELQLIAKGNNK